MSKELSEASGGEKPKQRPYEEKELNVIIQGIEEYKEIVLAPRNKENGDKKDEIWKEIARKVNAVSDYNRSMAGLQGRLTDWIWKAKSKQKSGKPMRSFDTKLLNVLEEFNAGSGTNMCAPKGRSTTSDEQGDQALSLGQTWFSPDEKKVLVDFVQSNKAVLLGAFTNDITREKKISLWQEVTDLINAVGNNGRSVKSVREKWSSLCSSVKEKQVTKNTLERRSSGKHDIVIPELSQQEDTIIGVMGQAAFGLASGIDSLEDGAESISDSMSDVEIMDIQEGDKGDVIKKPKEEPMKRKSKNIESVKHFVSNAMKTPTKLKPSTPVKQKVISTPVELDIIAIERQKLEVMKDERDINRERLHLERSMYEELVKLNSRLSSMSFGASVPAMTSFTQSHGQGGNSGLRYNDDDHFDHSDESGTLTYMQL